MRHPRQQVTEEVKTVGEQYAMILKRDIALIKSQMPDQWKTVINFIDSQATMPIMSHTMTAEEISRVAMLKQGAAEIYLGLTKGE